MAPVVVVVREPGRTPLHLVLRDALEIGRDCAGLLVDDPQVSRRHVELRPDGGRVEVRDLGSTNGTWFDGRVLEGTIAVEIGDVVRIGDTTIQLAPGTGAGPGPIDLDRSAMTSIELVAEEVTADRRSLRAHAGDDDHGTVTIVFSDIESSTPLAVELGDTRWFELLSRHNELVRAEVERHRGTEIKAQGDGFMLTFTSARSALQCMVAIQRAMGEVVDPGSGWGPVRIRVGIHTGEVIIGDDGDIFGGHVNKAARVAGVAGGGEILVSSLVREIVETRGDLRFGDPRTVELKGFPGTQLVHPLLWDA